MTDIRKNILNDEALEAICGGAALADAPCTAPEGADTLLRLAGIRFLADTDNGDALAAALLA